MLSEVAAKICQVTASQLVAVVAAVPSVQTASLRVFGGEHQYQDLTQKRVRASARRKNRPGTWRVSSKYRR